MGESETLPADWLAQQFATVDAEIAAWPEGLRKSFADSYGRLVVIPQPPAPTDDVEELKVAIEESLRLQAEFREKAEVALAEVRAELAAAAAALEQVDDALDEADAQALDPAAKHWLTAPERIESLANELAPYRETERLTKAREKIARLTAERDRLAEAARPFVAEADRIDPKPSNPSVVVHDNCQIWQNGSENITRSRITYGDLRRLRAALAQPEPEKEGR